MISKVTVVIPIYNNLGIIKEIKKKISLLLSKKYQVIIIDDNSYDGCYEELKLLEDQSNTSNLILFKNERNMGPSYSRNRGIKEANGDYIAFLDSDDEWHPQKIELQVCMMKENNVKLCGTMHKVISESELENENKNNYLSFDKIPISKVQWPKILFVSPFATPSVVIHSSLKNYLFDETMRYSEDYNLWKRITYKYEAIKIQLPLTYTFKHDYVSESNSLSSNLKKMQLGVEESFKKLIDSDEIVLKDKLFLVCGLYFSKIKYYRRLLIRKMIR